MTRDVRRSRRVGGAMDGDAPFDDELPDDLIQFLQGFNAEFAAQLNIFPPASPVLASLPTPPPPPPAPLLPLSSHPPHAAPPSQSPPSLYLPPGGAAPYSPSLPPLPLPPRPPPPPPPLLLLPPPSNFTFNELAPPPFGDPLVHALPPLYPTHGGAPHGPPGLDAGSGGGGAADNVQDRTPYPTWMVLQRSDCFPDCTLLREIVHGRAGLHGRVTSEHSTWRIVIHGGSGRFYHAILHVATSPTGPFENYFADLRAYPCSAVKRFLMGYGSKRRREGLVVVSDSTSEFYDALCTRLDFDAPPPPDPNPTAATNDSAQMFQPPRAPGPSSRPLLFRKTHFQTQRERSENLSLEEISSFFHLPLAEASEKLRLCTTALKRVCRRNGLQRWPYRKVNSANKAISKMQRSLRHKTGDSATRAEQEIEKARETINKTYEEAINRANEEASELRSIERAIAELEEQMAVQFGEDANRTANQIAMLRDRLRSQRKEMIKKGKAPMQE